MLVRRSHSIALSVLVGIGMGTGGTFVVEPMLPTSPIVRGLRVDGDKLEVGTDLGALLEEKDRAYQAQTVVLQHGDHVFETTYGELGARIDVDETLRAALAVGHTGSVVKRLRQTREARRGEIDVPLVYEIDPEIARRHLKQYAEPLRREPVDAEIDLVNHTKVRDQPGQELDVAATIALIGERFTEPGPLALVSRSVEAETTLNDLADIDVSKVLASFETKYRTWKRGRSANVELAAKKLNGLVIRPLQTVSFNERVGPRSREAGFQQAPEIVGDELTVGIGGGTCQVSTTFYAAALYGGMKIVDRQSHSRPSSYTKLGLDATVSYPKVDLKVKNPFNFPLIVHSFIPEPGTIKVEILGGEAVKSVDYRYGISSIEEYVRRITVKSWMKNRMFRKQKGTRGMDVHSHVTIVYMDGRVEEKSYYSGYRATPEVYWVSPDYDEELPPLPAHAKGVEGQLREDGSDVYPTAG
jgi:vancomycin resistance protein YoaR